MPDPESIVKPITSTLRWLVAATVVLYIALGALAITNYHRSHTTKDALCTLRADLEKRIQISKDFLIANPKGVAGIPAKTIQTGIVNQEATVKALGNLNC